MKIQAVREIEIILGDDEAYKLHEFIRLSLINVPEIPDGLKKNAEKLMDNLSDFGCD